MSDDLVKRLREVKDWWREPGRTAEQAADRIEALEAALRLYAGFESNGIKWMPIDDKGGVARVIRVEIREVNDE